LRQLLTAGFLMNAFNNNTTSTGLRGWWLSPPRAGMQRLIHPWAYRHLGRVEIAHVAGGALAAAFGVVCLWYGSYGWGAFFLALAALNLADGWWLLTIDPSREPEGST
jgi:hypothetical protein